MEAPTARCDYFRSHPANRSLDLAFVAGRPDAQLDGELETEKNHCADNKRPDAQAPRLCWDLCRVGLFHQSSFERSGRRGAQSGRQAKDAVRTCCTEPRARFPEHERAHGRELGSSEG